MEPQNNNDINELDSILKNLENKTPDDLVDLDKKEEQPSSEEPDKIVSFNISLKEPEPEKNEKDEIEEKKEILSKIRNLNVADKAFKVVSDATKKVGKGVVNALSRSRLYIAGIVLLTLPVTKIVTDAYISYKDNQSNPKPYVDEMTIAEKESQQKLKNSPVEIQQAYTDYVFATIPEMEYYSFFGGAFNELQNNIAINKANYEYTKEEATIDPTFATSSLEKSENAYKSSLAKVDEECWTVGIPSMGFSNTVFCDAITQGEEVYLNYNTLVAKKEIDPSEYGEGNAPSGSIVTDDGKIYVSASILKQNSSKKM